MSNLLKTKRRGSGPCEIGISKVFVKQSSKKIIVDAFPSKS